MANDKWQMANDKWQMANDKWQIIVRLPGVSRNGQIMQFVADDLSRRISRKSQILKMWLTSVFAASATKVRYSKCG
ncbi:MAG: hypothetical protein J5584_02360 [Clostridia bacterium]|nr:hypothetical protein [Clostridia bacterium]